MVSWTITRGGIALLGSVLLACGSESLAGDGHAPLDTAPTAGLQPSQAGGSSGRGAAGVGSPAGTAAAGTLAIAGSAGGSLAGPVAGNSGVTGGSIAGIAGSTSTLVPLPGGSGAAGAVAVDPPAAACSGKPGSLRGKSDQTVMAGGVRRNFDYYAPADLDPNMPAPLVIVAHGANMSGPELYDLTEYSKMADREKFVVVFPTGRDGGEGNLAPWNVGAGVCGLGALVNAATNDQALLDEIIKFTDQDQCLDRNHIFMSGFSMGGYLAHESGCQRSDLRAIAPHSAGTHDLSACPTKRKPVIMFHFKNDALINYSCGVGARDGWVKRNGCAASDPDVVEVKGGKCEYYKGCPADGQVAFCSFERGDGAEQPTGHGWSAGVKVGRASFAAITGTESANDLSWAFFKKYAW